MEWQWKLRGIGAFGVLLLMTMAANDTVAEDADFDFRAENVDAWKHRILPTDEEMAWRKIPWLPNLQAGIEAAADSDRPIMLWTMNGHPLGCT